MAKQVLSTLELVEHFLRGNYSFVPDMPDISEDDFEDAEELSEEEMKEFNEAFYEEVMNGYGFGIPDDEGNVFHDPAAYEAYHGKKP